jgi:predicted component of type VI protein secretion system
MLSRRILAAALTAGCLLLGGCREHNEPVKPIADLSLGLSGQPARA